MKRTTRRFLLGTATSLSLMAVCVVALLPFRNNLSIATAGLVLVLPVVVGVVVGGAAVGIASVAVGFLTYVLFFIKPYYTLYIGAPQNWIPLGVYVVVTGVVSQIVAALDKALRDIQQSSERLHQETQLLQHAQHIARLGTFHIDLERQWIVLSPELSELYGEKREAAGMALRDYRRRYYHPDDLAPKSAEADVAYQETDSLTLESRVLRPDGKVIWVRSGSTIEEYLDGTRHVLGIVQDVTDLVLARRDLEEKATELQRLAENASDIVFQSDLSRNLVWISPSVEEFVGRTSDELLGTPAIDLIAEPDRPVVDAFRAAAVTDGGYMEMRVRMKHVNGSERWVTIRARPLRSADGALEGIVGGVRDCHEEVMADRAAQTLSGGSLALARATDEAGLLEEICRVAVERGGYLGAWYGRELHEDHTIGTIAATPVAEEAINRLHSSWSEPDGGMAPTVQALRTGRTQVTTDLVGEVERREWRETAERFGLRSSASLPVRVGNDVDGVFVVYATELNGFDERAVDTLEHLALELGYGLGRIRERIRLEEATRERDRTAGQLEQVARLESIGQLAGGIAHDFNNLLTVQMSYSTLADGELDALGFGEADAGAVARLRSHVGKMTLAAEQAADLTQRLLTFARAKRAEVSTCDLNQIVEETEELLRRVVPPGITIRTELGSDLARIDVDPGQIGQVLMNLVVNASDAMAGSGTIAIRTDACTASASGSLGIPCVRLQVLDDGPGMPDEVREHAFEPFFTTKAPGSGTGLGLATVYGIVTRSGGAISIGSEAGIGTTMDLLFPCSNSAATAVIRPGTVDTEPRTGQRVLVVDDEGDIRDSTALILEAAGYDVRRASGGQTALRVLANAHDPIELLVTDLEMPQMTGIELARRAAELHPDLRVVLMSGHRDLVLQAGERGSHFLQKPFSREELLAAVSGVLSRESH